MPNEVEAGKPKLSLTVLKTTGEFDAQIKDIADLFKRQNGLVPGLAPSQSREHSNSVLYFRTVEVMDKFMPPRLPATVYYPRLVYFGDEFLKYKEYRLASAECYSRFMKTDVRRRTGGDLHPDLDEQLALETRSTFGLISCDFFMAMEDDPEMRRPQTVEKVVRLLCQTRSAMQVVSDKKDLYWLIYNGTVTLFTLSTPLIAFGYPSLVVEFLAFACLSMEAQVPLCQIKYIGWRVRLYTTVCLAYEEAKMKGEARAFAERGLNAVRKLHAIESLDPVPPPAAMKRLLATAETEMLINVIRYSEGGSNAMQQLQELPHLKDKLHLPGVLLVLVRAVIQCIQDSQRRTIRHVAAREDEAYKTELLTGLQELLAPHFDLLIRYHAPPPPPDGEEPEEDHGQEKPKALTGQDYEGVVQELPYVEMVELLKCSYNLELLDMFKMLRDSCLLRLNYEAVDEKLKAQVHVLDALYSLEHPEEMRQHAADEIAAAVVEGESEEEARVRRKLVSLSHVSKHLTHVTSQNLGWSPESASGPDVFADAAMLLWNHLQNLLDTVDASSPEPPIHHFLPPAPPKPMPPRKTGREVATAETPDLPAAQQPAQEEEEGAGEEAGGEEAGGEEAPDAQQPPQVSEEQGKAGTAAAWATATLRQLATVVLSAIHATMTWVQVDDGVCCATVALRLAFILEKRHRNQDALLVIEQAIDTLNRARMNLLKQEITGVDGLEALSSVSTFTANVKVPRRKNEEVEQALACLHVDCLHVKYRVILGMGVDEARRRVGAKQVRHADKRLHRTKDHTIFGAKSRKVVRQEWEEAEKDEKRPVLPEPSLERALVAACNRNLYEKAIVLCEMARLPRKREERLELLEQAVAALEAAQQAEELLEKQMHETVSPGRTALPTPPRLVMRGATEMIVIADVWRRPTKTSHGHRDATNPSHASHASDIDGPRDSKPAEKEEEIAGLAVLCKEQGSGVAVSLKNVSYPGTGIPRPANTPVLITGLTPNESYVFAVAGFDRHGHVIQGVGASSTPVVAQLPLPIIYIFGQMALSAHAMHCPTIANLAGKRLYSRMVIQGRGRSMWEQAPTSQHFVDVAAVKRAPPPLLRLFVLVLIQLAQAPNTPSNDKKNEGADKARLCKLSSDKARLRGSKKLIMAVYVAAGIDDSALASQAAIALYHLLIPLLESKTWHSSLLEPLTLMRLVMRIFLDGSKETGAKEMCLACDMPQVRRVLSCLTSALIRMASELEEPSMVKNLLEFQLAEEVYLTGMEGYVASREERALIQSLLSTQALRDKSLAIQNNELMEWEAAVLALLRGSPEEAKAKIPQGHERTLELTLRVVEQAMVENKLQFAKTTIEEAVEAAKEERVPAEAAEGAQPTKEALPALEPPPEELEEAERDKKEEAADAHHLKDLEIQFLTPSEELVGEWEAKRAARLERSHAREATYEERVSARRAAAADRILKLLLPRIRWVAQKRSTRQLVAHQQPLMAQLQMNLALIALDEVMRTDQLDQENWPEAEPLKEDDPSGYKGDLLNPPPKLAEGEEGAGEEWAERPLPKRAMQSTDAAYVPLPVLPGSLRGARKVVKGMVRAVVLACRARQWRIMLNASIHVSNIVKDLFGSEVDGGNAAFVAPSMRAVGDCLVELLQHQIALVGGLPAPSATSLERASYLPPVWSPPNSTGFSFSNGKLHGVEDGNGTEHDLYQVGLVSALIISCLEFLAQAKRWVAVACLGSQIEAVVDSTCGVKADMLAYMLPALQALLNASNEKKDAQEKLKSLHKEHLDLTHETNPGGRLMESLRSRAKERAQALQRIDALNSEIASENKRIERVRFMALAHLPGTNLAVSDLLDKWEKMAVGYERDKNRSVIELERCRSLVKALLKAQQALQNTPPPVTPQISQAGGFEGGEGEGGVEGQEVSEEEEAARLEEERAARELAHQHHLTKHEQALRQQGESIAKQAESIAKSYSKCVGMLREKREKEYLPWALNEYAHVLLYLGNVQAAGQAWNDALDCIFGLVNVGRHWREQLVPEHLVNPPLSLPQPRPLQRLGLKSLLGAACMAGNLSKCVYTSDLHSQLEYSLFAAHLFAAPFEYGLPHPQRARDFAMYVPLELVADEDGFSDAYAVDAATLMDLAEFSGKVLFRNEYGLEMLPMMSVYQWCAKVQTKDALAYANATVLKARACAQQGFLTEAAMMLFDLHAGIGLPDILPFARPPEGAEGLIGKQTTAFTVLEPVTHPQNLAVLEGILTLTLPAGLVQLYSPKVKHELVLCRYETLLAGIGAHPIWPHPDPALQAICTAAEALIGNLRQSLVDVAAAQVALEEGSEVPDEGEEGRERKVNGYTRVALSVVTECELHTVLLLQKGGEYTKALQKVDALMALLVEQDELELGGAQAVRAFRESPTDMRQHTDAMLWLQCRRARTQLLFLQGRWGLLKVESARALQDMADCNEQLLARDVMARQVHLDICLGKKDLIVSSLEEMIGKAMMLHHTDHRLATLLAFLADFLRMEGCVKEADVVLLQAEGIMESYLAVRALPQNYTKYLCGVGLLIKIKVRRAELALQVGSNENSLDEALVLCHQIHLLIPFAPYVALRTRARFHFVRARARRQRLVFGTSRMVWGGRFVGGSQDEAGVLPAGDDEAPSMSEEERWYTEVVQDLQATLTLTVEQGGYDVGLARCVMLEAACLHGATVVSGQEPAHLLRAISNLKLASELAAKRKALLEATVDGGTGGVPNLPSFVTAETAEAALQRVRSGIFGQGNDGGGGDDASAQRSLVAYLLGNLREEQLMLFDDDHSVQRISMLYKPMVEGLPSFAAACKVSLGPEEITASAQAEPGQVIAQWYSPMDLDNSRHGQDSAKLMVVLAPLAQGESPQTAVLKMCSLSTHAACIGEVVREAAATKYRREEAALGPSDKVASSNLTTDVFPDLGRVELQGAPAVAAREALLNQLAYNTNIAFMRLMGVQAPAPQQQQQQQQASADAEAAEAPPQGPKMLGLDNIHLLVETVMEQGICRVEPELCEVFHTWLCSPER